jgi:multisubunit Na+/H+ antiporter MnhB subunit
MQDGMDSELGLALKRLKNGDWTANDLQLIGVAFASGQVEIIPKGNPNSFVQSGGTNLGESNDIRISGSIIGTQIVNGITVEQAKEIIEVSRELNGESTQVEEANEDRANRLKVSVGIIGLIVILLIAVLLMMEFLSNISISIFSGLLVETISLGIALLVKEDRKKMFIVLIGGTVLAGGIAVTVYLINPLYNNQPLCPTISQVSANPQIITVGGTSYISVIASNPEKDALTFLWEAGIGTVPSGVTAQRTIEYLAPPSTTGPDTIKVTIDNSQCIATATVDVQIVGKNP